MSQSKAEIAGRIDDVFAQCTSSSGSADLKTIMKTFWPVLDNKVSMVDLAGVFTMCVSSGGAGTEALDLITFAEFFNGVARVKYSSGGDFCEKLLQELRDCAGTKVKADSATFLAAADKAVVRTLLKYDMPLRRAFSGFAGQNINVGGGLTWEEVQKLSVGMEVSGFSSLAGSHNLIPATVSLHKAENLARDVLAQFPLNASGNALNSALLYPQFQLLLCFAACERQESLSRRPQPPTGKGGTFARKVTDGQSRPLDSMLVDLVRDMGLDKSTYKALPGDMNATIDPFNALPGDSRSLGGRSTQSGASIRYPGKVVLPTQERPENAYTGTINHSRHAQLMRMDNLFEEVEAKVLQMLEPGCDVLEMLAPASDGGDHVSHDRAALKLSSKPVVIGDAVPVPAICPEPVEQLLQAALAHHNLGSFEEALKFLEAARMQLEDIARRVEPAPVQPREPASDNEEKGGGADKDADAAGSAAASLLGDEASEQPPSMIPLDLELYVTLCKGNVYQSCGDDEQSLLHYMDGWDRAVNEGDRDWEIVCLNSIGTLAYYSLRYNVALICFGAVAAYRMRAYGLNSADTATAWNNEGAAMFCLSRRAEARLRFEKGWAVLCNVLGHRAPRSITGWKNLEKSRRASSSLKSSSEGLAMRPDIDRLVLGGTFMVQATVPFSGAAGKKKGGGKKGKKK